VYGKKNLRLVSAIVMPITWIDAAVAIFGVFFALAWRGDSILWKDLVQSRRIMNVNTRLWLFFIVVAACGQAQSVFAQEGKTRKDFLPAVKSATDDLVFEVENLQEEILSGLEGGKDRTLYRLADAVLGQALQFQSALKGEPGPKKLFEEFDRLDQELHKLLLRVEKEQLKERAIRKAAERVRAADEHLHYALFLDERSGERGRELMKRQARALSGAAHDLSDTMKNALTAPDQAVLQADTAKLAKAIEQFRKSVDGNKTEKELRQQFAGVEQAWERVINGLRDLPPRENFYLLRSATRLDRLHERLHRILGLESKRPNLIIQT
jgi:hypothetical protein